jgi:hypothetical protein
LLVTVTVAVVAEPGVSETDDGESWMENGAACLTPTEKVTEWLMAPLVPVTVIVDVVRAAFSDAAT